MNPYVFGLCLSLIVAGWGVLLIREGTRTPAPKPRAAGLKSQRRQL